MTTILSTTDAALLNILQSSIPLVERPFAEIGKAVGLSEAEVLQKITEFKSGANRIIRQISAIFDSAALGYISSLVAAKVEPDHLEAAAAVISAHPGVSHNYQRDHAYNLWYTLTVAPDSRLGLEKTIEHLHRTSGAIVTRIMPALRMYKIGVKFDLGAETVPATESAPGYVAADAFHPSGMDKAKVRVLQKDLPVEARPFDAAADEIGVAVSDLLACAQVYLDRRIMRRFSAVLHHRQAGFSSNAMGAWIVAPGACDAFGARASQFSAVSHCYRRPTFPDWPYSIFTMVHGRSAEECNAVLADISAQTGVTDYTALYSSREFKKVRVRYFTHETEAWEQAVMGE